MTKAQYDAAYAASLARPGRLLAQGSGAAGLDQALHQGEELSPGTRTISHIKWFEDGALNVAANCIDRHLAKRARPDRDHLGRRRSRRTAKHITYRAAARGSLPLRQCAEGARRQEGRPRHHLPADDPGSGLRHAGLRPHRRGAFGGVRRLLARQPGRPHPGLRLARSSSPPTKACAAARPSR